MIVHQLEGCSFAFDDAAGYCCTTYPDGTQVPAAPCDTAEYRQWTARNGYGTDTWRQCRDHELLHSLIAEHLGRPYSRALWNVAHGGAHEDDAWGCEEAVVMAFQQFCCGQRGENIDLLECLGWDLRECDVLCARLHALTAGVAEGV